MENAVVILTFIGAGVLVIVAGNEDACIGRTVTLTVQQLKAVQNHDVRWKYQKDEHGAEADVYSDLKVYDSYKERFAVQLFISGNTTNSNLIIYNAQRSDSGTYTCTGDGGFGESKTIKVSVSERCDVASTASSQPPEVVCNPTPLYVCIAVLVVLLVLAVIAAIFLGCLWHRERRKLSKKGLDQIGEILQSRLPLIKQESEQKVSDEGPVGEDTQGPVNQDEEPEREHASEEEDGADVVVYNPQFKADLRIGDGNVCGVTQVKDKIYVICFGSGKIRVFDMDYNESGPIIVQRVKDPHDVVSCKDTGHLYISDCSSICVWRVKFESDLTPITEKIIPNISSRSLSVRSLLLLVTTDNSRLRLVKGDGEKLEDFELPDYMNPRHAVQSGDKRFVVSYIGRNKPDCPNHHISEVDTKGKVLRTCTEHITVPHHLALDADGRVFVADMGHGQILLLNKELKREQILLAHTEAVSPYRLSYDQQSRQLVIGEFDLRVAKVFILDPKQ